MAGPYKILAKEGHLFRVDLPTLIAIYLVFSTDKLRRASNDPLWGQYNLLLLLIVIANDKEWEVEQLLNYKRGRGKKLLYRVKWLNADDDLE
jgi:hypothetical protein